MATKIHFGHAARAEKLTTAKVEQRSMPVAECAVLIRKAIEARRRDLVMTLAGRVAAKLYRFIPRFVDKQVVRASQRFYS